MDAFWRGATARDYVKELKFNFKTAGCFHIV